MMVLIAAARGRAGAAWLLLRSCEVVGRRSRDEERERRGDMEARFSSRAFVGVACPKVDAVQRLEPPKEGW